MDRSPDPVVFIHGLWVTAESWRPFTEPWAHAGYDVHTPEWPVVASNSLDQLRRNPPSDLGSLSIETVVSEMARFIEALPTPPLLVGHSFGGLFVQLLLDRGLGRAGVALNPAPIAGIFPGWRTLRAAAPAILRPYGARRPYTLSSRLWGERYANAAPAALQRDTWDRYVIPTSGRIIHQAAFWRGTGIDPRRRHQPLLITAGERDRLVTPYLSKAAFRRQRKSRAPTDFMAFPGRSHLLIAEPGWEAVAQACIGWDARRRQFSEGGQPTDAPPFHRPTLATQGA